ncbi:MAG: phosphoglycerate kinase [Actinomycetota bacterium]|nr:phosphoglycerate kinase [Actinomycetota bacterium]
MNVPELEDLGDLTGKSVFLRADLNVPLIYGDDGTAEVADPFRIVSTFPTLEFLLNGGAKVTMASHLGRPKGRVVAKYSMEPVRRYIEERYKGVEVAENLRFDPREEANDDTFVKELISGHDLYVNDAFGASHRAHASIVGPPRYLPSAAGRLLAKEANVLGQLLTDPRRPFVAIIGGAKVSDKLALIESMLPKVDALLIGGAMSYTFLAALGHEVGDSLFEEDKVETCKRLLGSSDKIHLPVDSIALDSNGSFGRGATGGQVLKVGRDIPSGYRGLDVGADTVANYSAIIANAGTILWNGPMGVFEDERFSNGTFSIGRAVAASEGFSVIGGGDSAAAIEEAGLADQVSHLSTGGGASLELLEKGDLPGLKALRDSASIR